MTTFRTQYDPSLTLSGHGLHCPPEEGRTSSEFADDTDINKIMSRYEKTGQLPQAQAAAARYGDFSQIPDFQTMRNKVIAAEELFSSLPAKVRAAFDNDPGVFVAAADTPEGIAALKSLGLGKPDDTPPSPSKALPEASPPAAAGQAAPELDAPASSTKKGK